MYSLPQTIIGGPTNTGQQATVPITQDLNSAAFLGEIPFTAGSSVIPGRSLKVMCTLAGNINVQYVNGSYGVWPVVVGTQTLPISITAISVNGTTATATYANLV